MSEPGKEHAKQLLAPPAADCKERDSLPSLAALCSLGEDDLSRIDVAVFNLLSATGLPGAENLDIARLLDWLDDAAERVSLETRRHWYRFLHSPATYKDSPAYYCCYFLLQVLQEDFGVKYNPARAVDPSFQDPRRLPDFRDSRDLFIHGIIDGHGGTCGSMPVVYVAVGRRLGYPLKLVEARGHLFIRWEDPLGARFGFPERFNIEGAGYGMASFPDSHYETWPEPWTPAERAAGCYLKSLSPRGELAAFLATRAHCLIDNRRAADAIQALRWACALVPHDERQRNELARLLRSLCPSPEQLYERQMAIIRQKLWQQHHSFGTGGLHSDVVMPGHAPGCPCASCRKVRHAEGSGVRPVGHPTSCCCLHCKQAAPRANRAVPGHHPNCCCHQCKRAGGSGGAWARPSGHPPQCPCFQCQQASGAALQGWPGLPGAPPNPVFP
jgi:hypothetical protein